MIQMSSHTFHIKVGRMVGVTKPKIGPTAATMLLLFPSLIEFRTHVS
jgi:hypothetical protein